MYKIISINKNITNKFNKTSEMMCLKIKKKDLKTIQLNTLLNSDQLVSGYIKQEIDFSIPLEISDLIDNYVNNISELKTNFTQFITQISSFLFFDNKAVSSELEFNILKNPETFDKNLEMKLTVVFANEMIFNHKTSTQCLNLQAATYKIYRRLNRDKVYENNELSYHHTNAGDQYFLCKSSKTSDNILLLFDIIENFMSVSHSMLAQLMNDDYDTTRKEYLECINRAEKVLDLIPVPAEVSDYLIFDSNYLLYPTDKSMKTILDDFKETDQMKSEKITKIINAHFNNQFFYGSDHEEFQVQCLSLKRTLVYDFGLEKKYNKHDNFALLLYKKYNNKKNSFLSKEEKESIFKGTLLDLDTYHINQKNNYTKICFPASLLAQILYNIQTGQDVFKISI